MPTSDVDWIRVIKEKVDKKPIVVFRFDHEEWDRIQASGRGTSYFTFARGHDELQGARNPAPCFLTTYCGQEHIGLYFGLFCSSSAVTTLQTRVKIVDANPIKPSTEDGLVGLVEEPRIARDLRNRLSSTQAVVKLSKLQSKHLMDGIARFPENEQAVIVVSNGLAAPSTYSSNLAVQDDAISIALKAFGLRRADVPISLHLSEETETALARILHECS